MEDEPEIIICENKNFIQKILRDYERNNELIVESMEINSGSRIGDNYMSVVKRVKVKGTIKKINDYSISLIIKRQIASRSRRKLFRCDEAFENEINAYFSLVPVMKKISNGYLPYPDCIYAGRDHKNEEVVVLEDLSQGKYQMFDRLKGLNYAECKIVMKELANLHAISLGMKSIDEHQFQINRKKIKEIIYCPEAAVFYKTSLESSLSEALSSLQRYSNSDRSLTDAITKIKKLTGNLYNVIAKHVVNEENDMWKVICHGDIWINNLMFKKCDQNNYVENVKLIDLQTMRYASPVLDLLHFLYTSTEWELRRDYLDQLLLDYRTALIKSLKKYSKNSEIFNNLEIEFTTANIKKHFELKAIYGLGICIWILPAITVHPDRVPNLDSVQMEHFTTKEQVNLMTQIQTPDYHRRLKDTVLEFNKKGFLDKL